MSICRTIVVGACCLAPLMAVQGAEWSQFRGPNNGGITEAAPLPTEWSAEKNVQWKVAIPGAAWSCPVVWGDQVFVTTAITEKQQKPKPGGGFGGGPPGGFGRRGGPGGGPPGGGPGGPPGGRGERGRGGFGRGGMGGGGPPPDVMYRFELHCLDRASGKTLWTQVATERKPTIPIHSTNTYASETPIVDGERIYASFGMHGIFCYDLSGKRIWEKDLGSFPMQMGWGTGSSPALEGDRLFVQCDNEQESFLAALDKRDGSEIWRVKRDERSSWSTPYIWRLKGKTQVVACGGNRIRAYDPADGKLIWELGGISGGVNATPVANDQLLYVGSGGPFGNSPLFAVKASATGDITLKEGETSNAGVAWSRTKAGPSMASPLLYEGRLYILEQRGGMVSCYDAKTGEPAYYRKRIPDAQGFTSSPWASHGKVFCLDDSGQTTVLKAGPEFEVLGQNKIGEMCWSTPAFADGTLLLRSIDHLYSIK
ncbi:MAG: PQQ-binding-like beta-propeller repeat protein [Planctomycetales bacterium]